MYKFWEWMVKNDYCEVRDNNNYPPSTNFEGIPKYFINWSYEKFTKQMLIGYMIEYIITHNSYSELVIPKSRLGTTINEYYNYLEWYIEEYKK